MKYCSDCEVIYLCLKFLLCVMLYITAGFCYSVSQQLVFFTRDSIARICHANFARPSDRPSVTSAYCVKTAECIIEILSLSDRPIILVFRHQGSLPKSDGFTPTWGTKYKGDSSFRPICGYISETVISP